ncbi:MAG: DUF2142 domain-containing protein [Anaerolineae bacterium]|nr:DUF2142 domain-containing protein [Anaerolineae bacterium]
MKCFGLISGREVISWRAADRGIAILVVAFVLVATGYSLSTPLFEAPDELFHFPFVRHLAEGGGLPVQDPANPGPWNQEGGQPPLYYAVAALVTRWVRADDLPEISQRNPHADVGLIRSGGNPNVVVHTPREGWPYRGAALAAHLARGLSVLFGALAVLLTYRVAREVVPGRPLIALAAAALVGFNPMFLYISGAVSNDALAAAVCTLGLWLLVRGLRQPPVARRWAVVGAVLGLGALTKVSALGLWPLALVVLGWVSWRGRSWRAFLRCGASMLAVGGLIAGWWYYRNWWLYRDPLGWKNFLAIMGRRSGPATPGVLLSELPGLVRSYWGVFGWFSVTAPNWFYALFCGMALAALGGLVVGGCRAGWRGKWGDKRQLPGLAVIAVWTAGVGVGLVRWSSLIPSFQGRLLFPAAAAIALFLALGLGSWFGGRWREVPALVAGAVMAVVAAWVPFGVIRPAYAPPRLLTTAEQAAVPERLDLLVGEGMELLGYRLDDDEVRPGQDLSVTLYWRARARMDQNYSVFVHLLAENELIVGQRDTYPGRGLFPTTLWEPGDAIANTYVVPVSPTAFSPTRAQLEVGLYRVETGERLVVRDREGRVLGDNVRFGEILVRSEPRDGIANPLDYRFGEGMALIGYDLDRTALRAGETLRLTLYWKCLAPMAKDYTVFTHVLGPGDAIWAQKDAWPQDGAAPTSTWQVGQVIADRYDLVVKPETPGGVYDVEVGVYLAETLERLSVLGPGGRVEGSRVLLNPVRVVP